MAISTSEPLSSNDLTPLYGVLSNLEPPELRLWLSGELDFSVDNGLHAFDDTELAEVRTITVDLSELSFIDAAGVRALRAWHDSQTGGSRNVTMVSARRSVRRIFELMGADGCLAAA
jgi:anti-anti-sigma factor